jgi:hypothetical protein
MAERRIPNPLSTPARRVVVERLHVRFAAGSATLGDARAAARHAESLVSAPNERARGPGAELGGRIALAVRQSLANARGGKRG